MHETLLIMSYRGRGRSKIKYIPSKKDRQFIFSFVATFQNRTANDLISVTAENNTPKEYWTDTYIDVEICRWGYVSGPTVGEEAVYPGAKFRRPETTREALERQHQEAIDAIEQMGKTTLEESSDDEEDDEQIKL